MIFQKASEFRLGRQSGWDESFIQNLLAEDPSLLGLGDLVIRDKERIQPGAGRLDLLFAADSSEERRTRYEVEIQLGTTNPSHIIRTIEYWDRERRRYPIYDHVAVIVAEEIDGRFFNVISLFNQHIPLVAIKMSALQLGESRTIVFTKVLDLIRPEPEAEPEFARATEQYWLDKTSDATLEIAHTVLSLAQRLNENFALKFNKTDISLKSTSGRTRLLALWPKKRSLKVELPIRRSLEIEERLQAASLEYEGYDEIRGRYIVRCVPGMAENTLQFLGTLIQIAYEESQLTVYGSKQDY